MNVKPERAFSLKKIKILQRGRCDKRAIDGMECDALLEWVRSRLALMWLRQLILRMRERVQLRRLLDEEHHYGQQQAFQRARAVIEYVRHIAILVHPGWMRYLTRHCCSP